ncbi:mavicyanin [Carica papaya]|uniref:mavicyanin n=1 Tax=Carica papaya TaxID=3649 RepID=UPI000B8C7826|nr:mavicyanin [Carica papaya]
MASLLTHFCTCLVLLSTINGGTLVMIQGLKEFKVGDEFGWQEPTENNSAIYNQWATSKRFHVGDSLYFEYKNDSVVEVEKWGYYHCNSSNPIVAFDNGRSIFKLDRPGAFYFISGISDHCKNGQRLIVEVMGLHHHLHSPPPSMAMPPEHQLSPSPSPNSPTNSGSQLVSASLISSVFFMALAAASFVI